MNAGQGVTVVATVLQFRNWRQLRRFFRTNGQVVRQLKATPGSVSFKLRADFLRLRFFTISVWENDQAIDAFVWSGFHMEAMAVFDTIAVRERSQFVRWKTSDVQAITWEEAADRLAQKSRSRDA